MSASFFSCRIEQIALLRPLMVVFEPLCPRHCAGCTRQAPHTKQSGYGGCRLSDRDGGSGSGSGSYGCRCGNSGGGLGGGRSRGGGHDGGGHGGGSRCGGRRGGGGGRLSRRICC